MGCLQPFQRRLIKVVGRDSEALLMLILNFISPSSHANARGAQGIQGSQVMAGLDQPIVLQGIGQQQH